MTSKSVIFIFAIFSTILFSCAPPDYSATYDSSETHCQNGNAVIQVLDELLVIRCGCTQLPAEANKTVFGTDKVLTCHLANPNSYVFFMFSNNKYNHQISFTDLVNINPSASGIITPSSISNAPQFIVFNFIKANTTYYFQDNNFPLVQGQIIVP